tara:strand:- start:325 stop:1140 length:816 start_codon:yes stop_codon:yes gene_type:complete
MPEGPETKRMADSLSKTIKEKEIVSANFLYPTVRSLNNVKNLFVSDVTSLGKSIIIRLSSNQSIITHNQLYGKWSFNLLNTKIKHNRKLRMEFLTEKKVARLWSATDIVLLRSADEKKHHYIKNLGPDILDQLITNTNVIERLKSKPYRNRNLGGLLLNQRFISGLGNYLRSEILFFSGLMPSTKPNNLTKVQSETLAMSIKQISMRAYYQKGNTIDKMDFNERFGNADNFRLIRHMVFGRANQPCFHCGDKIQKIFQSSRRLYFCKTCQS